MEITLTGKKENALLNREEIKGNLAFNGATPSQKEFAAALAKKLNTTPDRIFVVGIHTSFGSTTASFEAHAYKTREDLEKTVRLGKKAVEKVQKEKEAEAAEKTVEEAKKAEEKKEEKPAEKKEELKEEKPAGKKEKAKPA